MTRRPRWPSTSASWPPAWRWCRFPTRSPPRRWPPACASPAPGPVHRAGGGARRQALAAVREAAGRRPAGGHRARRHAPPGCAPATRPGPASWPAPRSAPCDPFVGEPDNVTNILFSSGTTGEPKAIPWTQLQPIKSAVDAALHLDVAAGRRGRLAHQPRLDDGALADLRQPAQPGHHGAVRRRPHRPRLRRVRGPRPGERAGPGAVDREGLAQRRPHGAASTCSAIKCFGSTGEASNPVDYLYLMMLAGYRPVIEYCGGTGDRRRLHHRHAGAARLAGHLLHPGARLAAGPARRGRPADRQRRGVPGPAHAGLLADACSTATTTRSISPARRPAPTASCCAATAIRSSGCGGGYFRALGRVDDTMNLGGIKVSSAEIERVLDAVPGVQRTAAVAINPPGRRPQRAGHLRRGRRHARPQRAPLAAPTCSRR